VQTLISQNWICVIPITEDYTLNQGASKPNLI